MFDVLSMARERENQGHYVARMEIGDTPGFRNDYIHELITKHSNKPFRYSPSRGEPELISKVIETQWPGVFESQVVIGPANFLITAALASKTSPGDFVLLPDPGFASYKLAADFLGLNIVYYSVYEDGVPVFPNLGEFISRLNHRPKALIVNNPSNPLGIAFDDSLVSSSLENVRNLGVEVIFDETYVNLVYDGTRVVNDEITGTRIRSFSKEHCAPGLRIGYVVSDVESATTMANLMSLSISCVPQFIQYAVAEYLGSSESINFTKNLSSQMSQRLNYLTEQVPKNAFQTSPNAAFYALLNTGEAGGDSAFRFLLDRNVSTCPGSKFGQNSRNSVRVSLAGSKERFEKDISMLADGLENWFSTQN
jgi:aspartate aminotransferase